MREELNVKALRFVEEADELGSYEVKPNYRTLGPRFGKSDAAGRRRGRGARRRRTSPPRCATGATVGVNVDGHDHELTADDLLLAMQPLDGYQLEREGSHAVALELALDDELRREGLAREVVHAVQNARKDAGLDVSDRIALTLGGDDELVSAAHEFERLVADEVLATSVAFGNGAEDDGPVRGDGRRAHAAHRRRARLTPDDGGGRVSVVRAPKGCMSDEQRMDDDSLAAVVAAIPPGRWMSYGDVVAAAGGVPAQARASTGA